MILLLIQYSRIKTSVYILMFHQELLMIWDSSIHWNAQEVVERNNLPSLIQRKGIQKIKKLPKKMLQKLKKQMHLQLQRQMLKKLLQKHQKLL